MVPGLASSVPPTAGPDDENSGKFIKTTIDRSEIEKFAAMAEAWWDPIGKFRPLHRLNPVRINFIRDRVSAHFGRDAADPSPLTGLTLIDIGCGGGLLTEPMARLGAQVTGVDATPRNVEVARLHAEQGGVKAVYLNCAAEDLVAQGQRFDIVLAMEIIEHVADVDAFLEACGRLLKPGGIMFIATMSRTIKSYAMAIIGAEYVMRWLPKGTHEFAKFIKPSELANHCRDAGLSLQASKGLQYNPITRRYWLDGNTSVPFSCAARSA